MHLVFVNTKKIEHCQTIKKGLMFGMKPQIIFFIVDNIIGTP